MFQITTKPHSGDPASVLGDPCRERGRWRSQSSVHVTPVTFLILVPGGMTDVSRQDPSGCPAACPSSAHQATLPPDLRKNPLSEEKEAPLLEPLICLFSAQGKKGIHRYPLPSSTALKSHPLKCMLFRKEKQQQECWSRDIESVLKGLIGFIYVSKYRQFVTGKRETLDEINSGEKQREIIRYTICLWSAS